MEPVLYLEGESTADTDVNLAFRQEVDEIREIVHNLVQDDPFSEKVHSLYDLIEEVSVQLKSRRNGANGVRPESLEAVQALRQNVDDLHQEWNTVAATLLTQRERLEALLDSFPGAIETSTIRALSLRVSHLERLVEQLVDESRVRSTDRGSRTQLRVSLVALGVTVLLWIVWITLGLVS